MAIRRNIAANFATQVVTAFVTVAFIPVYVHFLGIEAYGLVGLFTALQAWMVLFDFGFTPALAREMARFAVGAHDAASIRHLLRSVEAAIAAIAGLVILGFWLGANWLATNWLTPEELPVEVVTTVVSLMGIVIGLRLIENVYRNSLTALERQIPAGALTAIVAVVRSIGAIGVLAWVSPTVVAFFVWQALVSLLSAVAFAALLYASIARSSGSRSRPSVAALRGIGRFAGGTFLIALSGTLISQSDKLILSSIETLAVFAVYSIAYIVAAAVRVLVQPVDVAVFPRLVHLHQIRDEPRLASLYHRSSQLNAVLLGSSGAFLAVFGEQVLELWTQDTSLASEAFPILRILVVGMVLNGFMNGPYYLQLAAGWTGLLTKVNWALLLIFLPGTYWLSLQFGAIGAAVAWLLLNAVYMGTVARLMHQRLLPGELRRWYVNDLFTPVASAVAVSTALGLLFPTDLESLATLAYLIVAAIGTFLAAAFAASTVRAEVIGHLRLASNTIR